MKSTLVAAASLLALAPAAAFAADQPPADSPPPESSVIIVTANPFGHGKDDTPSISAKIDAAAILARGGASLADSLADVPGIAATGFATGASRPIIRGMDANRVRMLEDGTSSADVSDIGPDHGVPLDPLAARSIEVIRGAATLRYGSQAIGGVVNAINNRVPQALPGKALTGEATGSWSSQADTSQGSALVDARAGNVALHADGFVRDTGDYDTPLGVQANSWFRGHGASAGASWFPGGGDSRLGLAVTRYDAQYGIPSDVNSIDLKQTKLIARSQIELGGGPFKQLRLDGSYGDYAHSEREPDGTIVATFLNREWDGRGELVLDAIGPLANAALGFEYQHRAFSALGDASSYLLPTVTESLAGYGFVDSRIGDRLHVEASGRIEHVTMQGTPAGGAQTRRSFTPVSVAVGALYEPVDGVKLGLTFASTARAPAITELYARGPHDGPATYETGDPNLKPERAHALEASLRVRSGRFRLEGSVYSNWFRNYVYGALSGQTCDEDGNCAIGNGADLRELNYRQQGAHFRGLEGEASYDLIDSDEGRLTAKLLGDLTRATLDDGSNVPRIPPYRFGGGLNWESARLDAGATLVRVGRQDHFGPFDTATAGYLSLSAQVAWRPFAAHPGVELLLAGHNLTNAVQRNAAALNKDLVVAPGRSVRVVLKVAG